MNGIMVQFIVNLTREWYNINNNKNMDFFPCAKYLLVWNTYFKYIKTMNSPKCSFKLFSKLFYFSTILFEIIKIFINYKTQFQVYWWEIFMTWLLLHTTCFFQILFEDKFFICMIVVYVDIFSFEEFSKTVVWYIFLKLNVVYWILSIHLTLTFLDVVL